MHESTIRPFRSITDASEQYRVWLAATEGLTRPWRSCLRNVEHQLRGAEACPGCRLYAERADGSFAGYIGAHPPFEWDPQAHGPPRERLGWAVPLGLPWTHPRDRDLEVTLYDRMIASLPETFARFQRDLYIQRFRETWDDRLRFLTDRGWRLLKRLPLFGHATADAPADAGRVRVTTDDCALLAELSRADPTAADADIELIRSRCDGGWLSLDECWRIGEDGAFALEPRGAWAAVTAFFARPDHWDRTLDAAAGRARELGAGEIYFTIDEGGRALRRALERRGFGEVDAGVYYVREAD